MLRLKRKINVTKLQLKEWRSNFKKINKLEDNYSFFIE